MHEAILQTWTQDVGERKKHEGHRCIRDWWVGGVT